MVFSLAVFANQFRIENDPVYRFAADISNNDQAMLQKVRGLIEQPPTTPETIGFFGLGDEPPRARTFLATVWNLDQAGYLYSVDSSRITDLFVRLSDDGLIDAELPQPAATVFGLLVKKEVWDVETEIGAYGTYLNALDTQFGVAARQLEDNIFDKGKVLLSVDPVNVGKLYFAVLDNEKGYRWRNKGFAKLSDGYISGVRAPMWDVVWSRAVKAWALPTAEDTGTRPLPPEIKPRDNDLAWAK